MRNPFHVHYDPSWQMSGIHIYEKCKCGAARTRRAYVNMEGPSDHRWPSRVDDHGVRRDSSGWQRGEWPDYPNKLLNEWANIPTPAPIHVQP